MHSIRKFFIFLILLNSSGFIIFQHSFVSALNGKSIITNAFDWIKSKNPFEDFMNFAKPIEDDTIRVKSLANGASSWLAKSVKTAIAVTTKFCKSQRPLTFFTALDEICLVNRTCKDLKITVLNPITVATLTGGILGHDLFEFTKYSFAWQTLWNSTLTLEAQCIYRNLKYHSFEEALDHSDGIAMINFPIATDGDHPNPKFDHLSDLLQTKVTAPGDHATIISSSTYTWFVNFPFGSVYHTYTVPYWDEDTDKKTTAIVIELPLDKRVNYISKEQFQQAFGKKGAVSGHMSHELADLSPVERHKGIIVLYLPA